MPLISMLLVASNRSPMRRGLKPEWRDDGGRGRKARFKPIPDEEGTETQNTRS